MTTIDTLSQQHQEVMAELAAVESRLNSESDGAAATFADYLRGEVLQHFALEESALFPVLERHMGAGHGPLAVMNAEHVEFRELLAALADGVASGNVDRQHASAHSLIDLLREHIAKEDGVLFPMASRLLSPEEQREVDARAATLPPGCVT